ncbi:inosose dehydratase [Rhodococcus sp. WMMA185]|uniref:TIM barrel protein n=1 Tax=Rhodococcus sp. WMMA185 TaxID=679318 RepID=UPI000877EB46|nr:TIM barrel protein [Rhodococcus sp. WMMA185]AOW92162.1 inosose dehydratase [Rhodococcus sp. WMMA185]
MTSPRIAGAPISWGVCEVPGWGYQLDPSQVLREMRDVGLTATEIGPEGFLPTAPTELAKVLAGHHLRAVGGFAPVLLHDNDHDPVPDVSPVLDGFVAAGAEVLVLAAATGSAGYDSRPEIGEQEWKTLLHNLDRLADTAAERGIRAVIHPHVGTMIEERDEILRVLDGSSIPLCLDTGHLLIGGTDPVELTRQAPDRIAHVHLKDVDEALAARVRAGEITYTDAVKSGIFQPLGKGDIDIPTVTQILQTQGFDGWYVLEQDTILTEAPSDEGPLSDVRTSVAYLRWVL